MTIVEFSGLVLSALALIVTAAVAVLTDRQPPKKARPKPQQPGHCPKCNR